jgi:hypothetical protein
MPSRDGNSRAGCVWLALLASPVIAFLGFFGVPLLLALLAADR